MAAGTLSVTNNSKAVVGVGTTFTSFNAGDFLTLVVGQVPYTVAIASIESDTALTLVLPFDGPTTTGLAWDGVKRDTMSLATMGVTVQAQKALRLMIADENNWRAIFGDAEEITVTLPNGQVMQGMSWGYLSQLMKQIDPVEMLNLQQQAAASEAAAQGYRDQAEGIKTETAGIRDDTRLINADTLAIRNDTDAIRTNTNQIKSDTQAIKDQTNQIKTDTGVIRDEANTAKTDAQSARDAALGYRNEAEQFKNEIDPSKLLAKANNLSDVADPAAARYHLGIGPNDTLTLGNLVTTGNISTTGGISAGFQFRSPKGVMGYSQLWSEAVVRADDFMAQNGAENYKSLIAGAAVTQGIGFSGGVSFGIMTTGMNNWPRAQISIGTADRDAAGNMASQMHIRFNEYGQISYVGPLGAGSFQQVPASDRNLKHDIADDASSTAYDNIKALRFRTFVFNNDEQERLRRGIIAQEAEEIDPLYVKHRVYNNHELNGPLVHQLELDTTPLLLDTMRALQDTIKQVEDLKSEIAALKQAEDLKK